jgi:hypothetical protein
VNQDCEDTADWTRVFDEQNFPQDAELIVNPEASLVDGALRLTGTTKEVAGSAFFTTQVKLDAEESFAASFAFRITPPSGEPGGDGVAFLLHNAPIGPAAVGLDGGGLGFQNIKPGIAIEFDSYANPSDGLSVPHVAIMRDGDVDDEVAIESAGGELVDGETRYVFVHYDGHLKATRVYLSSTSERPETPILTLSGFDIGAYFGSSVYVGFTASTGQFVAVHEILAPVWFAKSSAAPCP